MVQISLPEVEDLVMRKLMTWVYTGDLGKTSNLYQEEVKAAASVLQLDLKVKDSVADTPKSLQKSSRGKKAPATSPALNLVEDYEKAETEKKAKTCSSKMKCNIKFVQENGDPMSEADNSPKKQGKKRGAVKEKEAKKEKKTKESAKKKKAAKKAAASSDEEDEEGTDEYEVEKILEKREIGEC